MAKPTAQAMGEPAEETPAVYTFPMYCGLPARGLEI
jgi:hypothetical protein